MKYFDSFPKVYLSDYSGNSLLATNLMARTEIIPSLLKSPLLFYTYDIQEHDTPDSVANKYYGDPYRYWLIFFANQMFDPLWDWPLTSQEFNDYIIDKYVALTFTQDLSINMAYAQETIYGYTKTIQTIDNLTGTVTDRTINIDEETYNLTFPTSTTQVFHNGNSVTQNISKNIMSLYDFETQQNEAKRTIQLIDTKYVSLIESQFTSLMAQ